MYSRSVIIGSMTSEVPRGRVSVARRGAFYDCQKFAWRLVGAYPVTRALPEISRGREKKNDKAMAGWPISRACVPMGTFREKWAAPFPRARVHENPGANPCDKEGPKLLNTLGKGSVLRLYLVTVSF